MSEATDSAGYDVLRDSQDEDGKPEGYDPCCGKCVSGIDPWHNHAAVAGD